MELEIIYLKANTFILLDRSKEIIIKVGSIGSEENIYDKMDHINVIKKLDCEINFNEYDIVSTNDQWINKSFNLLGSSYTRYICFEKVYSNLLKHPNKINVCDTEKIIGIPYDECFFIKLSLLFQVIHVVRYLNTELKICHFDITSRNLWVSETDMETLDYNDYTISSYGYLVKIGDFGNYVENYKKKCSDLFFCIDRMVKHIKFYYEESKKPVIYNNENAFDLFLNKFDLIYNRSLNLISGVDYNNLLSDDIFEPIIISV